MKQRNQSYPIFPLALPYLPILEIVMQLWNLFLLTAAMTVYAQDLPSAREALKQSIAFHDPQGAWSSFDQTLELRETRPNGPDRKVTLYLPPRGNQFDYRMIEGETTIIKRVIGDTCKASLNGSETYSEEEAKTYRLGCDQIKRYRNYYLYLLGLPMKLTDQGTRLADKVDQVSFEGQNALQITVTYEPEVGTDIWHFFLDPKDYHLLGCAFYKDESLTTGETIVFEGLTTIGSMKLPRARHWYVHGDRKFLGTDTLLGVLTHK